MRQSAQSTTTHILRVSRLRMPCEGNSQDGQAWLLRMAQLLGGIPLYSYQCEQCSGVQCYWLGEPVPAGLLCRSPGLFSDVRPNLCPSWCSPFRKSVKAFFLFRQPYGNQVKSVGALLPKRSHERTISPNETFSVAIRQACFKQSAEK